MILASENETNSSGRKEKAGASYPVRISSDSICPVLNFCVSTLLYLFADVPKLT